MDTIAKQKALADRVYALLCKDYDVLLAGGAPRDWHIGQKARDLDFYIYSENPEADLADVSERLDIELNSLGDEKYGGMKNEPSLRGVFEGKKYGEKIQFMFVGLPPLEFVKEKFDLSICKVWYADGEICMDWEARLSFRENLIVMKDGYNMHADKLMQRKPWHRLAFLGSWERALGVMGLGANHPVPLDDDDEDLPDGFFDDLDNEPEAAVGPAVVIRDRNPAMEIDLPEREPF